MDGGRSGALRRTGARDEVDQPAVVDKAGQGVEIRPGLAVAVEGRDKGPDSITRRSDTGSRHRRRTGIVDVHKQLQTLIERLGGDQ